MRYPWICRVDWQDEWQVQVEYSWLPTRLNASTLNSILVDTIPRTDSRARGCAAKQQDKRWLVCPLRCQLSACSLLYILLQAMAIPPTSCPTWDTLPIVTSVNALSFFLSLLSSLRCHLRMDHDAALVSKMRLELGNSHDVPSTLQRSRLRDAPAFLHRNEQRNFTAEMSPYIVEHKYT